jgi:hypothetical protein
MSMKDVADSAPHLLVALNEQLAAEVLRSRKRLRLA